MYDRHRGYTSVGSGGEVLDQAIVGQDGTNAPAVDREWVRMRSSGVRAATLAVGAVTALLGLVFAGQGLNLVPGSFMTGDRTWFWVGLVLVIVGVVLVVAGLRGRRPAHRP